jgi:hypothetical protein
LDLVLEAADLAGLLREGGSGEQKEEGKSAAHAAALTLQWGEIGAVRSAAKGGDRLPGEA